MYGVYCTVRTVLCCNLSMYIHVHVHVPCVCTYSGFHIKDFFLRGNYVPTYMSFDLHIGSSKDSFSTHPIIKLC